MQLLKKLCLFLAVTLGICAQTSKGMENNVVTDPIAFAQNILHEWGYHNILVSKNPTSFFSSANSDTIFLGNDWSHFARKPELLKAILGHELMHIKHDDHAWNVFLGIPWYCVYRAAVAFFWAHGATSFLSNVFNNHQDGHDWEERDNEGGYFQYLARSLAPIITGYFSAARIGQDKQFILTKDPWSFALFGMIYCIITAHFSQAFGTFMSTITHALQTLFDTTSIYGPAPISVIIPLLLHSISKYGAQYTWSAFKRLRESYADVDSARTFATGAGLIKWLNAIKQMFPTDNIERFNNFHPTADQRIASIQAALNNT